jgi:hypothetical protein
MHPCRDWWKRAGNRWLFTDRGILKVAMATNKTFYMVTFGCQMKAHNSEKVIGTLLHEC